MQEDPTDEIVPDPLRGRDVDIVELTGHLLARCRRHASDLRRAYGEPWAGKELQEGRRRARALLDDVDAELLSSEEVEELFRAVREIEDAVAAAAHTNGASVSDTFPSTVAARAVAEALDGALGPRYMGIFRSKGQVTLTAEAPFPVPRPPLKEMLGRRLSTNPNSLGPAIDNVEHLHIMPSCDRGHVVRLRFDSWDVLGDLRRLAHVAALIPGDQPLDWVEEEADDGPRFFHVRPKGDNSTVIEQLLEEARAAGHRVALLPELAIAPDGLERILAWCAQNEYPFDILVCGSVHVEPETGERRNRCTTLLRNGRTLEHDKFNRFEFKRGDRVYREDVRLEPAVVSVHYCACWSFTTLICKDVLEPEVDRILESLRVTLVLVPACSPKMGPFEAQARSLASKGQSTLVVANLCDPENDEDATVALISRPVKGTKALERVARADAAPPRLIPLAFVPQEVAGESRRN